MKSKAVIIIIVFTGLISMNLDCKKNKNDNGQPSENNQEVNYWLTKGDRSALLQKQNSIRFSNAANTNISIEVDSSQQFQVIDGFGYTLTGGSAFLINKLSAGDKTNLLQELFGKNDNSIGISYLRVSIGASDLSAEVFSYDDMPAGQTDVTLDNFNLSKDTVDLIPLLKEILAINPGIKILGSPWSPPVWMKDNGNSMGGSLQPQYYNVYAQYFIKYIKAMKTNGIMIDAITIQNEPQHGGNNPSMVMSATQQADFIKNNLGPAFQAAGINSKIIVWDHNCDNPTYPVTILNDPAAKAFVNGSAFHLYAGDISALSTVHNAHPDKDLYFTEQWTGANGTFAGDLQWHVKNVVIGSMRNWSKVALEWNLANDQNYNPHTPGGCTECKGALTINGTTVTKNVAYYIIAHASKFVPPASIRIASNNSGGIYSAAFITPAGKKVVIAVNDMNTEVPFNIKYKSQSISTALAAGAVATYVWD